MTKLIFFNEKKLLNKKKYLVYQRINDQLIFSKESIISFSKIKRRDFEWYNGEKHILIAVKLS